MVRADETFIILGTFTRDIGEGATVFVSHMAVRRIATKIWTISDTTVYVSHMYVSDSFCFSHVGE